MARSRLKQNLHEELDEIEQEKAINRLEEIEAEQEAEAWFESLLWDMWEGEEHEC